jgi:hypothetical protein
MQEAVLEPPELRAVGVYKKIQATAIGYLVRLAFGLRVFAGCIGQHNSTPTFTLIPRYYTPKKRGCKQMLVNT